MKRLFACPNHAAGLNIFLDPHHWLFIWHAVKTFNDLRSTRTETENKTTVADIVTTSSRHRHQRRCTAIHIEDAGTNLYFAGLGSQVPDLTDGIGTVGLGDPDCVQSRFFVFDNCVHCGMKATGIIQHH